MLAMHRDGLIALPPPLRKQNRPGPVVFGQDTEPSLLPPPATLDEVRPLEIRTVVGGTREGRLWNEFVARHHRSSTTPASSFCRGSASPISDPTSSHSSAAACPGTGPAATTHPTA